MLWKTDIRRQTLILYISTQWDFPSLYLTRWKRLTNFWINALRSTLAGRYLILIHLLVSWYFRVHLPMLHDLWVIKDPYGFRKSKLFQDGLGLASCAFAIWWCLESTTSALSTRAERQGCATKIPFTRAGKPNFNWQASRNSGTLAKTLNPVCIDAFVHFSMMAELFAAI